MTVERHVYEKFRADGKDIPADWLNQKSKRAQRRDRKLRDKKNRRDH